jgi:cation:H+ antiporter
MVFGLGLVPSLIVGAVAAIGLVYGAEHVVDKLTSIAEYYAIPDVLIAMSVISIGTSLPELVSHLAASMRILLEPACPGVFAAGVTQNGQMHQCAVDSAVVLGMNIGSDVVQQTLVVGLVVFTFSFYGEKNYFQFSEAFLKKDYFPMIGTTLMTLVVAWDGILSRLDGLVLFGTFLTYMYYLYHTRRDRLNHDAEPSQNVRRDGIIAGTMLIIVIISAEILLDVTNMVVAQTGLSSSLIGVATIGVASALPELFTAVEGIRQQASDIALGTLIGSNITNPLLAIGLGSIASTYWVPRPLVLWDLPMETFTAAMLLGYLLFVSDRKLGFKGGLYLIGLYIFYLVVRALLWG